MPHRLHRPVLGGDLRRRRSGRAPRAPWRRSKVSWCDRENGLMLLFTPPFDQDAARSRLHQGLSARHPREWRPIHPCRALVGPGLRDAGRGRQGGRAVRHAQPDQPRRTRRPIASATRSSPTSWPRDVYSVPPHVGRGGWTWYTGSAGWMYRVGLEWILGFRVQGKVLLLDPCIPKAWPALRDRLPPWRLAL